MRTSFFLITALALAAAPLAAQDLVTDRPDFTESALVVPSGMVQIESGVEYVDHGGLGEWTYPNALARIGLGSRTELRLGFAGWVSLDTDGASATHLNDLALEAKIQLTSSDAAVPVAVLLTSTLPTGDDEVSVGDAEAGVILAASHALNDRYGIGVNLGAVSSEAGDGRVLNGVGSLAVGMGVTDKLGAFVEVLAEMPEDETWRPAFDGGFTYLVAPNGQLDLYLGAGLNDEAPDLFVGAGYSVRFGS